MKKSLLLASVLLVLFTACKKNKVNPDDSVFDSSVPAGGSTLDKIRDSVILYARENYYWYDQLPTYTAFNPRAITGSTDLDALQTEVDKMSQYAINPATKRPYEYYSNSPGEAKYSFIDEGEASTRLDAVSGDFGFAPFYTINNLNDLRVKYVYTGSPADLAGIKRGYQIMSINGNTSLNGNVDANVDFVVNAYSASSTITMQLKRPDNSLFTVTLNATDYKINPVIKHKEFNMGAGKKVGYIVFNSFVSLKSAQDTLSSVFQSFAADGITDLVVDLRYNGGGYVETAEYLANLIAPSSATGSIMYTAYYNSILTAGNEKLLDKQWRRDDNNKAYNYGQVDYSVSGNTYHFKKEGNLNIGRVYFIVTGGTASASELTINVLRAVSGLNVQMIGSTTYGKPVGFFDIDINKYEMYIPEFETKNGNNEGGYYDGMTPATSTYPGKYAVDDLTKDFGDSTEYLLSEALTNVTLGHYSTSPLEIQSINAAKTSTNLLDKKVKARTFNGMLFEKHKLK